MINKEDELLISQFVYSTKHYAYGDIVKSLDKEMMLATFILCFCLISTLSSNRYFKSRSLKNDSQKFVKFIEDYFPKSYFPYANRIYVDLRSKMVHNYSVNGKFILTRELSKLHLTLIEDKVVIDLNPFVTDIENAMMIFFQELSTDKEILNNTLSHSKRWRPIRSES